MIGQKEVVFDRPMTPSEIQNAIYSCFSWTDTIHAVLQQEVVLYCGRLIATNPDIFKGILKIRVGWVVEAMKLYLEIKGPESGMDAEIENLSPFQIRQLLMTVLTVSQWGSDDELNILRRRQLEGCLCRVPNKFYNLVWDVLDRCPSGIQVQGHHLAAVPTLSNMSRGELSFALLVEEMLHHIPKSERRQVSVELICIVATILSRNPELRFQQVLDIDLLLEDAFTMYCKVRIFYKLLFCFLNLIFSRIMMCRFQVISLRCFHLVIHSLSGIWLGRVSIVFCKKLLLQQTTPVQKMFTITSRSLAKCPEQTM